MGATFFEFATENGLLGTFEESSRKLAKFCTSSASVAEINRFVLRLSELDEHFTAPELLSPDGAPPDEADQRSIRLDHQRFELSIGNRTPLFLGNTAQFRLLRVLYENEGRFLSFERIAEETGGDWIDASTVKSQKCRLARLLRERGYGDLASCIKTQTRHYGLRLSESAIQK